MANDLIRNVIEPLNRDMLSLRDVMERLWDTPRGFYPRHWAEYELDFEGVIPAIDVAEDGVAYTLKAALPGWKPENVNITYEGSRVTIEGEVKDEIEDKKDSKFLRREIRQRSFCRSFSLPAEVDSAKARAEFKDGLLTITLPKSEVVKPKQIKIVAK